MGIGVPTAQVPHEARNALVPTHQDGAQPTRSTTSGDILTAEPMALLPAQEVQVFTNTLENQPASILDDLRLNLTVEYKELKRLLQLDHTQTAQKEMIERKLRAILKKVVNA